MPSVSGKHYKLSNRINTMRIMLVPGNGNADVHSGIWYPWITGKLRSLGLDVVAENMPDANLARKEYWES